MAQLIYGDRIGKTAKLTVGCAAIIFDSTQNKILLTRRTDNGRWCLPGGAMDAGESVAEACEREVREETGLIVKAKKLIGVYSNPHIVIAYADGTRKHVVSMAFEVEVLGGELGLSDETTEYGYFSRDEMRTMDVMEHHFERIDDALANRETAFVR